MTSLFVLFYMTLGSHYVTCSLVLQIKACRTTEITDPVQNLVLFVICFKEQISVIVRIKVMIQASNLCHLSPNASSQTCPIIQNDISNNVSISFSWLKCELTKHWILKQMLFFVGIYYGITIGIVSTATGMTVLTLNIHHKGNKGRQIPHLVRTIFFGVFAKIFCVNLDSPACRTTKVVSVHINQGWRIRISEYQVMLRNIWYYQTQTPVRSLLN